MYVIIEKYGIEGLLTIDKKQHPDHEVLPLPEQDQAHIVNTKTGDKTVVKQFSRVNVLIVA